MDLRAIYLTTLERCAPDVLVREHVDASMPRNVVAIGKCAGALLDGVAAVMDVEHAFVAIPEGYRLPATPAEVHVGGHPHMSAASFAAGEALLQFVDAHEDLLFLVSGGGSACVEVPLAPYTADEVAERNARLIASGAAIAEINAERRTVSAIKGGRLRERVRGRCVTLVYSDVAAGALHDVASGPTYRSYENDQIALIADNSTLVRTVAQIIGDKAVVVEKQVEGDVLEAVRELVARAAMLKHGEILVAGGEPTVRVVGDGRGGRCSEMAVRFATESNCEALFGSSDGVDGSSGCAGIYLPGRRDAGGTAGGTLAPHEALARSDSYSIAVQIGEPIMIAPTGNNLRDLFLVRGS